jgi:hypothetical protein
MGGEVWDMGLVAHHPDDTRLWARCKHTRNGPGTKGVVAAEGEHKLALICGLFHGSHHCLAALADCVAVSRQPILWIELGITFRVLGHRQVALIVHPPPKALELLEESRVAEHVWAVVCARLWLPEGHWGPKHCCNLWLREKGWKWDVRVVNLSRNPKARLRFAGTHTHKAY